MNTIQTNTRPQTTTAPATEAASAERLGAVSAPAAPAQPFVFVDGEPPPDAGMISSATYTAGLAQPAVDPRQWPAMSAELDLSNVTTTTSSVNAVAEMMSLQDVLMRLMMSMRTSALKSREDDLQLMVKQKNLAIDKGLEAAKAEMVAGVLAGAADIASGAMSVVGAAKGEGMRGTDGFASVAVGKFSGVGSVISGALKIASAGVTYSGAVLRAEQQRYELAAEVANARMSQSNEQASNYKEGFKAFMDGQLQAQRDQTEMTKKIFA